MRAVHDHEARAEALRLVTEGATFAEAADAVGVAGRTVARWADEAGVERPAPPRVVITRPREGVAARVWDALVEVQAAVIALDVAPEQVGGHVQAARAALEAVSGHPTLRLV